MIENLIFLPFFTNICLEAKPTLSLLNNSAKMVNLEVINSIYPSPINRFNYLFAQGQAEESPWIQPEESPWIQPEESPWIQPEESPWIQPEESPWIQPEESPWLEQYQAEKNRKIDRINNSRVRETNQSD
ncbi:hypothetical protein STA3757_33810 [Stanieria sp. NIES-3757]|nr:hypothetical protein STA3757_33810 [Stanieria sp. NIES-3757]